MTSPCELLGLQVWSSIVWYRGIKPWLCLIPLRVIVSLVFKVIRVFHQPYHQDEMLLDVETSSMEISLTWKIIRGTVLKREIKKISSISTPFKKILKVLEQRHQNWNSKLFCKSSRTKKKEWGGNVAKPRRFFVWNLVLRNKPVTFYAASASGLFALPSATRDSN